MKSQFIFEKKKSHLVLCITGEYEKKEFLTYPKIVLDECEKEKMNKVLVDGLKVIGTDTPAMDRYYLGERVANVLGYKIKIAVVWPNEHITKFAENVAYNRGGRLLVTDSLANAEEWLLSEE